MSETCKDCKYCWERRVIYYTGKCVNCTNGEKDDNHSNFEPIEKEKKNDSESV